MHIHYPFAQCLDELIAWLSEINKSFGIAEIIVSLNYHENENEPARLNIKRVRETSDWLLG